MAGSVVKFGKPIQKLIELVGAAIGTAYKPRAIRNEADAEAYKTVVMAEANAKAGIIAAEANSEIAERAKQRFATQEIARQVNIESVLDKTEGYLGNAVSDEPVEEDWRTRFFSKAQDVRNEEMQEIWAKILATEITKPGSISLKTLDTVSNLSKIEAEAFQSAASFAFNDFCIITLGLGSILGKFVRQEDSFDRFGLTHFELVLLRSSGLMFEGEHSIEMPIPEGKNDIVMKFGKEYLSVSKEGKESIPFSIMPFSLVGMELLRTIDVSGNKEYLKAFVKDMIKDGYSIELNRSAADYTDEYL